MVGREEKGVIICVLSFLLVVGLCTSIASIVIAEQDKDDSCIRGNRGGIDVADWLLGQGIFGIISCDVYVVGLILVCVNSFDAAQFLGIGWVILSGLFGVMWMIWGIVIVSTNENNKCIADGTRVGVYSLVLIALQFAGAATAVASRA